MLNQINGRHYYNLVDYGIRNLALRKDYINDLNVFPVPDGDTGTNMVMTLQNGFESMSQEEECLSALAKQFAKSIVFGARGNSGVIVSQFFKGFSESLATAGEEADKFAFVLAMESGVASAYRAVSNPVEGTVLTVVREATEMARREVEKLADICETVHCLLSEARNSLERTPELLPILKSAGVVDSGGAGMVYVLEGMEKYLTGQTVAAIATGNAPATPKIDFSRYNKKSVFKYGYCTEVLIQLTEGREPFAADAFRGQLETLGDSVVTVVEGDKVKVHIHTHTPEVILTFCHRFGEFLTLKIENMTVQHNETVPKEELPKHSPAKAGGKIGVVAVAHDGAMEACFLEMGADAVIPGDFRCPPSAKEFIDAFRQIGAKEILVFPNSKNTRFAAEQAKNLYGDASITVFDTKSDAECYAALPMIDFEAEDCEEVIAAVEETVANITTVTVSKTQKSSHFAGKIIHAGDYVAMRGDDVLAVSPSSEQAVRYAAKTLLDAEPKDVLTVFAGRLVSEEEKKSLAAFFSENYAYTEVDFINTEDEFYHMVLSFE